MVATRPILIGQPMLLIRHGQSEWNRSFSRTRVDPGLADPALTDQGIRQAEVAAARLADRPIRTILTSPYRRALQTACIIAAQLDRPVIVDPVVRERCAFSCDQGSQPAELRRLWPELSFDELVDDWWGRSIESLVGIRRRAEQFRAYALSWPDQTDVLVVSHWGFVRALTRLEVENATLVHYDPSADTGSMEPLAAAEAVLA